MDHDPPRRGPAAISERPVQVLFDISTLGGLSASRAGLTGVPRVVENLWLALNNLGADQCRVTACAPGSPFLAREYFHSQPRPSSASLAPTRGDGRLGRWLRAADDRLQSARAPRSRFAGSLRRAALSAARRGRGFLGRPSTEALREADVYHSPHGGIPPNIAGGRSFRRLQAALTVYDLIPYRRPEFFLPGMAEAQTAILRTARPREDWYLCISQCTKNDLCELFGIDPQRVFVTPLAADPAIFSPRDEEAVADARRRYGLPPGPYVMSLCTLEPRKNVRTVIAGFEGIVRSGEMKELSLLLVGGKGWLDEDLQEILQRSPEVRRRILMPGYVPDEDLGPLYSGALCFAYLSHYEGFGLPPLEAMQCGAPALVSNTSSLPEVVGDAGLMFAPTDAEGFAQGVLSLARDAALRGCLREKSLARARLFSWEQCARDTVAAYHAMLGQ